MDSKLVVVLFCGLLAVAHGAALNERIVNGEKVQPGEIPYQVSLQFGSTHFCGATIINENWVVTAHHCVTNSRPYEVQIAAGSVFYKKPTQKILAERFEYYSGPEHDIALIKLVAPLKFDENVAPVQLTEQSEFIEVNSSVVVSGWGSTGFGNFETPAQLIKAKIIVVDQETCRDLMHTMHMIICPQNVCAYDPTERRGQCNGDSGGPLTQDGKLVGLVSWSIKDPYCASTTYPGVYTRVSYYVDWIKKVTSHL